MRVGCVFPVNFDRLHLDRGNFVVLDEGIFTLVEKADEEVAHRFAQVDFWAVGAIVVNGVLGDGWVFELKQFEHAHGCEKHHKAAHGNCE